MKTKRYKRGGDGNQQTKPLQQLQIISEPAKPTEPATEYPQVNTNPDPNPNPKPNTNPDPKPNPQLYPQLITFIENAPIPLKNFIKSLQDALKINNDYLTNYMYQLKYCRQRQQQQQQQQPQENQNQQPEQQSQDNDVTNSPHPHISPSHLYEQLKNATYEEKGKTMMVISDKVSTFLGSFVKESSINDFYKFNFVPYDNEGFTIERKPWPTLVILRYNQQTGVVEIYTVSTSTTISQQYENTNTQQLTIENIVKLENETEYTKRTSTSTPNVSLKIIGTPTTLILGMKPDEGQFKFDEYSRNLISLINAANKTDYHLTRLYVYLPKSEIGFFKNIAINFFRKPKPNAANPNAANPNESGKGVTKMATKAAGAGVTEGIMAALFGGNKRTRRQRQSRFKKCTRRNKYTKNGKTHKNRH